MNQQQRLNDILDLLSEDGSISIEKVTDRLGVSAATARRDLNLLAEKRLVTRTHGGAVSVGSAYELPLQYKIARNAAGKIAIAEEAARLIRIGDVVGLTGGTTTSEIARVLGKSPHLEATASTHSVTIVTNALNIAYEMAIRPHVKTVVTGGSARHQSFELVGPLVDTALGGIVLDWTFVGVDGLESERGATTVDEGEALVNRQLAMAAKRVVVVADGSKLMESRFARILTLSEIDLVITDAEPTAPLRSALTAAGADIIVAVPHAGNTKS